MAQIRFFRRPNGSQIKDLIFASPIEILIGLARLIFACFALLAVYLDPTAPKIYVDETFSLLYAYAIFSIIVLVASNAYKYKKVSQYLIHLFDIAILSMLIHLTDGLDSPFFSFYTFSLFTATMRWGWRGAMATVAILALLLLILSWEDIVTEASRDSELNLLVMRGAYLFVAGCLLGYFGAYVERSRVRLAKLADWPLDTTALLKHPLSSRTMSHVAHVLGCERVLVCWWDRVQVKLASWSAGILEIVDVSDTGGWNRLLGMVDKPVFYAVDNRDGAQLLRHVFSLLPKGNETGRTEPIASQSYCVAPFSTAHYQGCVFVLEPHYQSEDIVPLTKIVALRIASELEQNVVSNELAQSAIAQERVRLSRDMHDSVLQDLTAANLLLKAISNRIPAELEKHLGEARWLLRHQQRRIRNFVEESGSKPEVTMSEPLARQLSSLADMLGRQWQCNMTAEVTPADLRVGGLLSAEMFQLICEATANAVRHGGATDIAVRLTRTLGNLHLKIADNGAGMPIGARSGATIEPQSIKKRVEALKGKLSLRTSNTGVQLSIELPEL